ncbi:uncharacterized protein LOC108674261 [Hyalella azteca]|uniref:Uncharacterized protein LOC108674261 n=1 Tax=Hyalella azteca TaxID=294128 RepID=A0A8B7NXT0_HYAAZ|nr:uncharacterized protein LOC108674261 [Hyalella azteca]
MCDEVSSSSCSLMAPDQNFTSGPKVTLVDRFDPICCFADNVLNENIIVQSQVPLSAENSICTPSLNVSVDCTHPLISDDNNTTALISTTSFLTSESLTPTDFATVHFCSEDLSDADVDPFSATVVYSGLTAIGDLRNVDTINSEVTILGDGLETSIQIHLTEYEPCTSTVDELSLKQTEASFNNEKKTANKKSRPIYKHVPHHEKPVQLVERRNARERRRVQSVNSAFVRLRRALPSYALTSRGKRMSKVKTLKAAMNYIWTMQQLLLLEPVTSAATN